MMIVAADHPARGALGAGQRAAAMGDRRELLRRVCAALEHPGVNGVLGTPDVIDDLLLLGALEDKVVIGSMNRGGLQKAAFELDDRFTAYRAPTLAAMGFEGGKMLIRVDLDDPATVPTLETAGTAVSELAAAGLMAMIEPFMAERVDGRVRNVLTAPALATAISIAAGLGDSSAHTWLKIPIVEDAGVQVFHGLVGLKTHCKLCLLARRDPDGVTRQYAHLGTGNYNATTARIYTDLSLLTADPEITSAVHDVFSFLTAYAEHSGYGPLLVAPLDLAEKCMRLIEREAEHARMGRPARIIAKMNALLDVNIVRALYSASQAGVDIELLVRGMCALRPGIRGISDRIRVRSIVGRFLEHSRIFYFENGGESEVYVGSADWMNRNLHERAEVLFPLKNPLLRDRVVHEILAAYLADNVKSRFLQKDGRYLRPWQSPRGRSKKPPRGSAAFSSQDFLTGLAEGTRTPEEIPVSIPPRSSSHRAAIGRTLAWRRSVEP